MHHPYPIVALAEDRSRTCPCGAIAERPWTLCRKCSARAAWRRKTTRKTTRKATRTNRHAARRLAGRRLVTAVYLLRIIAKGVES